MSTAASRKIRNATAGHRPPATIPGAETMHTKSPPPAAPPSTDRDATPPPPRREPPPFEPPPYMPPCYGCTQRDSDCPKHAAERAANDLASHQAHQEREERERGLLEVVSNAFVEGTATMIKLRANAAGEHDLGSIFLGMTAAALHAGDDAEGAMMKGAAVVDEYAKRALSFARESIELREKMDAQEKSMEAAARHLDTCEDNNGEEAKRGEPEAADEAPPVTKPRGQ